MNVSKAVIEDLLPLYAAGEASEDSRALVEAHLATDPAMRDQLKSAVGRAFAPVEVPPTVETSAIRETRRTVRKNNNLWGLAFGLSYVPMSFAFDTKRGITFLLARDLPPLALLFCGLGLAAWFLLVKTNARLQQTGLSDRRNGASLVWASIAVSGPLAMVLSQWIGPWAPVVQVGAAVATHLVWKWQREGSHPPQLF